MTAGLLRVASRSKYDHVAMLVKYPLTGQVVLFESLPGKGVCKWDWNTFQKNNYWRDNYSRIVYRRLLGVERTDQFRGIVQEFIANSLGKEYRLNASKLMGMED